MGVKGEGGHENGKMEKYVEVNLEKLKRCIVAYICCNIIHSNTIKPETTNLGFHTRRDKSIFAESLLLIIFIPFLFSSLFSPIDRNRLVPFSINVRN